MKRVCWVALGSNLDNPREQVSAAIELLKKGPDWDVTGVSHLHETAPMGEVEQPNYINAVVRLETDRPAAIILQALLKLEHQQGRVRDGGNWGPRVLDLDLLLCGDEVIDTETLTLPHPGLLQRSFVLAPMQDIDANFVLPNGRCVNEQLLNLQENYLL